MNRRRFAGWFVALTGTASAAVFYLRRPKGVGLAGRHPEEGTWQGPADGHHPPQTHTEGAALAAAIREYYEYLDLDPAGVQAFVTAHDAARGRHLVRGTLDDALPRFLLSTDFFMHGEDETRRLQFVAFYHPRATPCFHPFSIVT